MSLTFTGRNTEYFVLERCWFEGMGGGYQLSKVGSTMTGPDSFLDAAKTIGELRLK